MERATASGDAVALAFARTCQAILAVFQGDYAAAQAVPPRPERWRDVAMIPSPRPSPASSRPAPSSTAATWRAPRRLYRRAVAGFAATVCRNHLSLQPGDDRPGAGSAPGSVDALCCLAPTLPRLGRTVERGDLSGRGGRGARWSRPQGGGTPVWSRRGAAGHARRPHAPGGPRRLRAHPRRGARGPRGRTFARPATLARPSPPAAVAEATRTRPAPGAVTVIDEPVRATDRLAA